MEIHINAWHIIVILAVVVVASVGLLVAAERDTVRYTGPVLDSLPTPTCEPTPTLGWWGTITMTETTPLTGTTPVSPTLD
jgi:hypothetical protein